IWGIALERLFIDSSFGGIATVVTQKDIADIGATPEEIESIAGVVSEFLNAVLDESHDIIVVYRETEDGAVKGSARARTKNVAEIAEKLYGGGGHKFAAGFKVPNAKMEKTQDGTWRVARNTTVAK
ncbi:MAG: DHHA1 domain-containing protein, partial [Patescibacteria group bacterium]